MNGSDTVKHAKEKPRRAPWKLNLLTGIAVTVPTVILFACVGFIAWKSAGYVKPLTSFLFGGREGEPPGLWSYPVIAFFLRLSVAIGL